MLAVFLQKAWLETDFRAVKAQSAATYLPPCSPISLLSKTSSLAASETEISTAFSDNIGLRPQDTSNIKDGRTY